MIIAILPNEDKFDSITISKEIIKFLESHKVKVLSEKSKAALLNIEAISEKNIQNIEYFISLGGDGTILKNIHEYSYLNKPFLGINLGSLGFMTDIPLNDIYISLQDLLNKNFTIENRIMLEVKSNSKLIAANDIVFHRRENPSLIDLSVYLNGKYLNECTMYITLEPCVMCAGAIAWAQLGKLIYGAPDTKRGFNLLKENKILHPKTEVISGILDKECADLIKTFFQKKR